MSGNIELQQISGAFIKEYESRLAAGGLSMDPDWIAGRVIEKTEPELLKQLRPVHVDFELLNYCKNFNRLVAVNIMRDGDFLSDRDKTGIVSAYDHMDNTIRGVDYEQLPLSELIGQSPRGGFIDYDPAEVGDQLQEFAENRVQSREMVPPNERLGERVDALISATLSATRGAPFHAELKAAAANCKGRMHELAPKAEQTMSLG